MAQLTVTTTSGVWCRMVGLWCRILVLLTCGFRRRLCGATAAAGTKLAANGGTLDVFLMDQTPTLWVATDPSGTADLRYYRNTQR